MHVRLLRSLRLLVVLAVAVAAAGCGGDDQPAADTGGGTSEPAASGGSLIFGTSTDPVSLDGALVYDGESLRVVDQIFEGLVTLKPGTTEVEPALATSWEASADGKTWTFKLQEGVTFHDGEPFNADAVCFNFERWYGFEGALQNSAASYYWQTVFGGFKNPEEGSLGPKDTLYQSCKAVDEFTAEIKLRQASASFLAGLSLSSFSMASPKALEQFGADEGQVDEEAGVFRPTGSYAREHPTGTGPFKFVEWVPNDHLTIERNDDYWGEPAKLDEVIFKPIPDPAAQLQALQAGEIHGYDLVAPEDVSTIEGDSNLQLLKRPAFNVAYVGINQAFKPLDDIEVRKAIAYGLNRQEVVDSFYAGTGVVAKEFMPPELEGYADDVTEYPYDPEKAKQTLRDAGYELPVKIEFWYPTDVSRPYMPDPKRNFQAFQQSLEQSGFDVVPKTAPWDPDYLSKVDNGRAAVYLIGWTGDFGDADNFIGTFFQDERPEWGFDNPEIRDLLDQAEAETDLDRRTELYQEANRVIMDYLPGVPYAHSEPALAFNAAVQGYVPSPVSIEPFSLVSLQE
jgi:peptide/nickel transport system substrate-binding protein